MNGYIGEMNSDSKVVRTWRGWTTKANALVYQSMLVNEIFPEVKRKGVQGLEKITITTQEQGQEVEFFLMLEFTSLDAVRTFVGDDYQKAYMPENAQRVLLRYENTAEHHMVVEVIDF